MRNVIEWNHPVSFASHFNAILLLASLKRLTALKCKLGYLDSVGNYKTKPPAD